MLGAGSPLGLRQHPKLQNRVLFLALTHSVTLGKFLGLSTPQCPRQAGSTYLLASWVDGGRERLESMVPQLDSE